MSGSFPGISIFQYGWSIPSSVVSVVSLTSDSFVSIFPLIRGSP